MPYPAAVLFPSLATFMSPSTQQVPKIGSEIILELPAAVSSPPKPPPAAANGGFDEECPAPCERSAGPVRGLGFCARHGFGFKGLA